MKIALIGYGAMGQLVAATARNAGDEIGRIVTASAGGRSVAELAEDLRGHDVAIDFSVGSAVLNTAGSCALAGVPLVEGSTGWSERKDEVFGAIAEHDGALVYGANFSVGG